MESCIKIYVFCGDIRKLIDVINDLDSDRHKVLFVQNLSMERILDLNDEVEE